MRPLAPHVTFADSWQAFLEAPTTLGPRPGGREDWHQGRVHYALKVSDPDGGIAALRARTGADLRFGHPYLPHVTVGSYQADIPTPQIAAAMEPLRELPPLVVQIEAVELVDYDARLEGAPLKTRARLPLA